MPEAHIQVPIEFLRMQEAINYLLIGATERILQQDHLAELSVTDALSAVNELRPLVQENPLAHIILSEISASIKALKDYADISDIIPKHILSEGIKFFPDFIQNRIRELAQVMEWLY